MSDNTTGIVKKISALLSKTVENGCTEAEAMAAAEKVQQLLLDHNMQLSDIEGVIVDPLIRDNDLLTDRAGWIRPLMGEIARFYLCGYFSETFPAEWVKRNGFDKQARRLRGGGRFNTFVRHNFIGSRVNVIVAKQMAEYLIAAAERLCKEGETAYPQAERKRFRISFMNACTARLRARLVERRLQPSTGECTNLPAVLSIYEKAQEAFEDWKNASDMKFRDKRSLTQINHEGGALAGIRAGNRIGLDEQIADKGSHVQLEVV
jgi:hypothetical protein